MEEDTDDIELTSDTNITPTAAVGNSCANVSGPTLIKAATTQQQKTFGVASAAFYGSASGYINYGGFTGINSDYYDKIEIERALAATDIKKVLVNLISRHKSNLIREIVEKDYKQHLEMLDKLLILK